MSKSKSVIDYVIAKLHHKKGESEFRFNQRVFKEANEHLRLNANYNAFKFQFVKPEKRKGYLKGLDGNHERALK